jgi:hypothetical protein
MRAAEGRDGDRAAVTAKASAKPRRAARPPAPRGKRTSGSQSGAARRLKWRLVTRLLGTGRLDLNTPIEPAHVQRRINCGQDA